MFGLKKYKVIKSFNGYQVGALVGFNGADAEKYAQFIASTEKVVEIKAAPVIEVKEEVKAEKPKRKYVRKGKK